MMMALRTRMEERYAGWQGNLPTKSGWPAFLFENGSCDLPSNEQRMLMEAASQLGIKF